MRLCSIDGESLESLASLVSEETGWLRQRLLRDRGAETEAEPAGAGILRLPSHAAMTLGFEEDGSYEAVFFEPPPPLGLKERAARSAFGTAGHFSSSSSSSSSFSALDLNKALETSISVRGDLPVVVACTGTKLAGPVVLESIGDPTDALQYRASGGEHARVRTTRIWAVF